MKASAIGTTQPRIFTPPLRELTPETSLGFECIDYASEVLGIELRPWQQWLLIHALELLEDGSYRFERVFVLVGRQNGKTTVASVLASWWLFVDALRDPKRVPPVKFKIIGTAQNLDVAREPWNQVKLWCDPDPDDDESAAQAIPALQAECVNVSDTNGDEYIKAASLARYEIRAAKNIRGKPTARVIMDEMREQTNFVAWDAVSHTTKSFWSGQLWGFSNAGTAKSVVLIKQRKAALAEIASWNERVVAGGMDPADWIDSGEGGTIALFEWSAPDGCALDDDSGLLQANPSCGYGGMTLRRLKSDIKGSEESSFRTETLCQWVVADVKPYINPAEWDACEDDSSRIPDEGRVVLSVDVSADRKTSWVAAAGLDLDDRPHVEVIARRDGVMWVPEFLGRVRERWPSIREVAIQTKGCAAVDLADPLSRAGWSVHAIEGQRLGACAGRFLDRVREGALRHPDQPALDLAIRHAVCRRLGETDVWDRKGSAVQISGVVACSQALLALETIGEPAAASRGSDRPLTII